MRRLLIALGFCVTFTVFSSQSFGDIWIGGHGDIGVGLDAGELHLHMHLDQPGTRWDPILGRVPNAIPSQEYEASDHIIAVPNTAIVTPINTPLLSAILDLAGGESYYRLSSTSQATSPYVGLASEELDSAVIFPAVTSGSLQWALTGFSGPGNAAVWIDDAVKFSTFNPLASDTGNNTWTTTIGQHDHFNFGFSEEGTYALTFAVSAFVDLDGPGGLAESLLSDSATFTFQTGPFVTAVPEPTSLALLGSVVGLFAVKRLRNRPVPTIDPPTDA